MTETTDAPKGWRRREDGILEPTPDWHHYSDPGEAVMGWNVGNRTLVCTKAIYGGRGSVHMCGKPAKHDPDHNGHPTKCGVHSAAAKARREAKQTERYAAERAESRRQADQNALRREAVDIVRAIANGHNDPRTLCLDWCRRMDGPPRG